MDDAPAMIALDLGLLEHLTERTEDTLYILEITLTHAGPHGMGDSAEVEGLGPAEDGLVEELRGFGLIQLGRVRNRGVWQLSFMGPRDRGKSFLEVSTRHIGRSGRACRAMAKPDAEWSYYRNFLYPSAERMRWIQDRRVVDVLAKHGDHPERARRVDHWIYFESAGSRDRFIQEAKLRGFEVLEPVDDEQRLGVQIHRVDIVTVEGIHAVTTELTELADQHGGDYDGWETSVERDERPS